MNLAGQGMVRQGVPRLNSSSLAEVGARADALVNYLDCHVWYQVAEGSLEALKRCGVKGEGELRRNCFAGLEAEFAEEDCIDYSIQVEGLRSWAFAMEVQEEQEEGVYPAEQVPARVQESVIEKETANIQNHCAADWVPETNVPKTHYAHSAEAA